MDKLRQAAQQALEALEGWANHGMWVWPESALDQAKRNTREAIPALRAALAEQRSDSEHMEPVAWMYFDSDGDAIFGHPNGYRPDDAVPVYTAPQPAKPPGYKLVPVNRSYDMRVHALLAFNSSKGDRDDALQDAWLAMLNAAPEAPQPAKPAEQALEASASPTCNQALQVAARQALEAYDAHDPLGIVMEDLRAALAEHPAEQEPFGEVAEVAQGYDEGWTAIIETGLRKLQKGDKVYTAPQPAKPAEQEPVAWRVRRNDGQYELYFVKASAERAAECYIKRPQVEPLYTAPQPAKREPLTETTVFELIEANTEWKPAAGQWRLNEVEFARAIEAAVWRDTR